MQIQCNIEVAMTSVCRSLSYKKGYTVTKITRIQHIFMSLLCSEDISSIPWRPLYTGSFYVRQR